MFDFSKLSKKSTQQPTTDPRSIFQTLPKTKPEKYEYPRDVQAEVWSQWHDRRNEQNLLIKLNTGGGKTTVGLCILQSCLNENKGPAVYVAPNDLLVAQVMEEAKELGIRVTDDIKNHDFRIGNAIYVCNTHKVVNGRSVFGVGQKKIDVGSIVFDDVHACINSINDQFSITIPSNTTCYQQLFNLFSASIQQQSKSKYISLDNGDPLASAKVPYWAWQQSISEVHSILSRAKTEEYLEWSYPLLHEHLELCDCVVGGSYMEIFTNMIPIEVIPSLSGAPRKIFMTATLSDDSILSSHFGVKSTDLGNPITPSKAGDIGERMILAPQEINTDFSELDVRKMCKDLSLEQNVVVIVPSTKRAQLWNDYADRVLTKDNIVEGVKELYNNPKAGLTVMVNRYDGINLPGDACRVLVIDGLPEYKSLAERTKEVELLDCSLGNRDLIHKIEQGMGRGVRSNSDYCVVLLIGIDLISKLYLEHATDFFSPGTMAQLELSQELTRQIKAEKSDIQSLRNIMNACLKRDESWRAVASERLLGLTFDNRKNINNVIPTIRTAFDLYFTIRNESVDKIQEILQIGDFDELYKGYLKQIIAQYTNSIDPDKAQRIQQGAIRLNRRLLKPIDGIQRRPDDRNAMDQAANAEKYYFEKYKTGNDLVLSCNNIINSLSFSEIGSAKFEKALADAGRLIGFKAQQPDLEDGTGPDVFWYLGPDWGLLIECKNEATTDSISKDYCNQLAGHVSWHENFYGSMCNQQPIPVMCHPSSNVKDASSVPKNMHFLNGTGLESFKEALQGFSAALVVDNKYSRAADISKLLEHFNFTPDRFSSRYLRPYRA